MHLELATPTQVIVNEPVTKITAEAVNGAFELLPLHVDFVTALIPSILSYVTEEDKISYVAVDNGILVKAGDIVRVGTRQAFKEQDLTYLKKLISESFKSQGEQEIQARSSLHKLEAGLVRKFWNMEQPPHG